MSREIVEKVKEALVLAGTVSPPGLIKAYEHTIQSESNERAKWALDKILENIQVASCNKVPLCDDTGIPHIFIEIGDNRFLSGSMISDIQHGISEGLREMPGRPMAVKGDCVERIEQTEGIFDDPGAVQSAPFLIKNVFEENVLRVHVVLLGGGPAIRGKTQSIFHKHDISVVINEIVTWANEGVAQLGCTPCTLSIGIGRSQYEATAFMIEALIYGKYEIQSNLEKEITNRVNKANIGPLGLGGDNTVLATFLKIGPQRASGARIVSIRPNCCVEPRIACVDL